MSEVPLEETAEELLTDYELEKATASRVPGVEWEQEQGLYSLKVYSEEFLENDSRAVAGTTLEDVIKREASEEDDFYIEVKMPGDGFTPDREVYTFSREEVDEGLREVFSQYIEAPEYTVN